MRYYIMFGITIILSLLIIFYTPYLGIYKKKVTIKYDFNDEGYVWKYDIEGSSLKIDSEKDNEWTFKSNGIGTSKITFKYVNEEEDVKYEIYYKFYVIVGHIFWNDSLGKGLIDYPNPI